MPGMPCKSALQWPKLEKSGIKHEISALKSHMQEFCQTVMLLLLEVFPVISQLVQKTFPYFNN